MAIMTWDAQAEDPAKRPHSDEFADFHPDACRVAILGFGTVGEAVARLLCRNPNPHLRLTHVFNRNVERKKVSWVPPSVCWTESVQDILASDADVVVELAGGVEPAGTWMRQALRAGKSVVTANKHLIARHGAELTRLAQQTGQRLEYGASVAGGVPVLCGLQHGLAGDRLFRLAGVLNGTCNYILSKMEARGVSFADALAKAQELGYAEADPSDDIHGLDASCKLAILARVGLGAEVDVEKVRRTSIDGVDAMDFQFAQRMGLAVRQIALAEIRGAQLLASVQPALVPLASPLAQTRDNQNALVATGLHGGETVFSGRGAGGAPTSVAVVSDLLSIAQMPVAPPLRRLETVKSYSVGADFEFPHYLRFAAQSGVSAAAASRFFSSHSIEVRVALRGPAGPKSKVPLVLVLEPCRVSTLDAALHELCGNGNGRKQPLRMPILG